VGRIYATPYFNHQGPEWVRAFYDFAEDYTIDLANPELWYFLYMRGCEYLKVKPYTHAPTNEEKFCDLIKKVVAFEESSNKIQLVMSPEFGAKKPFLGLRWLYEITQWRTAKLANVSHITTNYINWVDAHASAAQHLVYATRDTEFMTPLGFSTQPHHAYYRDQRKYPLRDYYQEVTDKLIVEIKEKIEKESNQLSEHTVYLCKYLLGENVNRQVYINRSFFKKCIMGFAYSMTRDGMANALREYIEEENSILFDSLPEFPATVPFIFFRELSNITYIALENTLVEQSKFMQAIKQVTGYLSRAQKPVIWRSQLGLYTKQFTYKLRTIQLNVPGYIKDPRTGRVRRKRKRINTANYTPCSLKQSKLYGVSQQQAQLDTTANKNASNPNRTHGRDAGALGGTADPYFTKLPTLCETPFNSFPPLLVVHDSFGVPLPYTSVISSFYSQALETTYAHKNEFESFLKDNEALLKNLKLNKKEKASIARFRSYYEDVIKRAPKFYTNFEALLR
jgi:hypothetical protein